MSRYKVDLLEETKGPLLVQPPARGNKRKRARVLSSSSESDYDSEDHKTKRHCIKESQVQGQEEANPELLKKQSTIVWYDNPPQTNGDKQIVRCPYVSNDKVELWDMRPIDCYDENGELIPRLMQEKDNYDEEEDQVCILFSKMLTCNRYWLNGCLDILASMFLFDNFASIWSVKILLWCSMVKDVLAKLTC